MGNEYIATIYSYILNSYFNSDLQRNGARTGEMWSYFVVLVSRILYKLDWLLGQSTDKETIVQLAGNKGMTRGFFACWNDLKDLIPGLFPGDQPGQDICKYKSKGNLCNPCEPPRTLFLPGRLWVMWLKERSEVFMERYIRISSA